MRVLIRELLDRLPPDLATAETARELADLSRESPLSIVQLIYQGKGHDSGIKDYEFSRATMLDHWSSGMKAVRHTLTRRQDILDTLKTGVARSIDMVSAAQEPAT